MVNARLERLAILNEECAEVQQVISKIMGEENKNIDISDDFIDLFKTSIE